MPSSLILASGSKYKRSLLERLGLDFRSLASDVDESSHIDESAGAIRNATHLAEKKARDVHRRSDETWVVASDQIVSLDGERFPKPGSRSSAVRQLQRLRGRTHRLVCAVALLDLEGRLYNEAVVHEMEMRDLNDAAIRSYVDADRPVRCAGSYRIESRGIQLFEAMRGEDYTAIVGLPLTRVWNTLERAGYFERSTSGG